MKITDIPLIIISFNQLTYLRNLINWWGWYYPENPYYVIDNNSDYSMLSYYQTLPEESVIMNGTNDVQNVKSFIDEKKFEYYCISDPDIMPHPATPANFLSMFKFAIDNMGFHHAGFDLITYDIPDWNKKQKWIQGDEAALKKDCIKVNFEGKEYSGHKAPIDTTFSLYKRDNGGWSAPMKPEHWDNSLRILHSFHLPFYLDPDNLNEEMKNYYKTCLSRDDSKPSAGRNHFKAE